jgi:hypothetical protein
VGVVGFGGVVRWLAPSAGRIQLHRIVETLIETEIAFSYAWKKIDLLPPRTLPPQSLVLALSPLLDGRVLDALTDLRARGFDLAIVDVSPFSLVEPVPTEGGAPAFRLWRLWRDTLHDRYRALGGPVVDLVAWSVVLAAAGFVLVDSARSEPVTAAPVYGAGLRLVAELAYASRELARGPEEHPSRRVGRLALVTALALAVAALPALATGFSPPSGLGASLLALAAGAALLVPPVLLLRARH